MQLVPLQNLDVGFLKIEAAGEDPGNLAIVVDGAGAAEQFDHAAVFAVLDGAVLLRDEVGVVFGAHGTNHNDGRARDL